MEINLSKRDIDYISRVVETEVPSFIARSQPETYNRMVEAVTDTIINRVASPSFPNTVEGVVNQRRQFSKIAGPQSYRAENGKRIALNPYGTVDKAPKASELVQGVVSNHVAARVNGAPSSVGGALHYANPSYSSPSNQGWIRELSGPRLGVGKAVHHHGTAPGYRDAPEYALKAEGVSPQIAAADIPVPEARPQFDQGGILNPAQAGSLSFTGSAQAATPPGVGLLDQMAQPNPTDAINQARILSPVMGAPEIEQQQVASLSPQPQYTPPTAMGLPEPPQISPVSQGLPQDQFDARFNGVQVAGPAPQGALVPQTPAMPQGVIANPESYETQDAYEAAMAAAGIQAPQPAPQAAPQPIAPSPLQSPMQAPQPVQGFPSAPSQPSMYAPQPPQYSGMDVWQGRAMQGTATDGTELTRAANGDVYRYNPTYDHTQRVGPDGAVIGGVMQGRVEGPIESGGGIGIKMPSMPSFGMPQVPQAQTRAGNMVRGAGGAIAGGLIGSFLGGPIGGLLAAEVGRNMAQGNGILGNRRNTGVQTTGNAGLFPSRPDTPKGGGGTGFKSDDQYERAAAQSRAVADAIRDGRAGLF